MLWHSRRKLGCEISLDGLSHLLPLTHNPHYSTTKIDTALSADGLGVRAVHPFHPTVLLLPMTSSPFRSIFSPTLRLRAHWEQPGPLFLPCFQWRECAARRHRCWEHSMIICAQSTKYDKVKQNKITCGKGTALQTSFWLSLKSR